MNEEKFNITFSSLENEIKEIEIKEIALESIHKHEILRMYIENEISLKSVITEYQKRDLDLWREYKIYTENIKSNILVNNDGKQQS